LLKLAPLKTESYTHNKFHLVYTRNGFSFSNYDIIPHTLSCIEHLSSLGNYGTDLFFSKHDKLPSTTVDGTKTGHRSLDDLTFKSGMLILPRKNQPVYALLTIL